MPSLKGLGTFLYLLPALTCRASEYRRFAPSAATRTSGRAELHWALPGPRPDFTDAFLIDDYFISNIGLAISSAFTDSGCSAFQRMAAVMRVRPLG